MEPNPPHKTTNGPQPIHEAIRKVWLFSNLITFIVMGLISTTVEIFGIREKILPWPIPFLGPLIWIGIGVLNARFLKRQWESWRYEVTDHEVILSWGVWNQTKRFVPRDRVQHVDITSGPIARKFGLAHVHLYVAGAHGAVGGIPGLTPEEADDLRSMLVETQAEHV